MNPAVASDFSPFHRLLIANRGEIARRIIRTAHAMGIETVAIYSDADRESLYVCEATFAVSIGGTIARNSYLKIDTILEAARLSGADAIHPGYGFLAENAVFAERCRDEGLVFVGPSADAIRSMGDKAAAKALMEEAGVPCVPGYRGDDQSEERLATEAARIGFPVMIKAVAGGGGRGMRLVPDAASFAELLRSARTEAKAAFSNPDVLLERAIVEPKHVEIQVFGDRYGNAVHFGERDCSVQRRHQKVIEESPCYLLPQETRERMGAVATAAVQALRYEGAGTLEFLLAPTGDFFFMEMNTRLQVEHPVTEMVTGRDLVELQLRIAAGHPLGLTQQDIVFAGHAIEVRLCAEDERRDFLPQSGVIKYWQAPSDVRVESAVATGSTVPPYYDSMIAKLVAYGADRETARRRLIEGLRELRVIGVATNRDYLKRCLSHPVFVRGDAATSFVAKHKDDLAPVHRPSLVDQALIAVTLRFSQAMRGDGALSLGQTFAVPVKFTIKDSAYAASLTQTGTNSVTVEIDDWSCVARLLPNDGSTFALEINKQSYRLRTHWIGSTLYLDLSDEAAAAEDISLQAKAAEGIGENDGAVRASMNGRVTSVVVAVGDTVEAGAPLILVEAMKMEHVHRSPAGGVVEIINAAAGDQVTQGEVLILIGAA